MTINGGKYSKNLKTSIGSLIILILLTIGFYIQGFGDFVKYFSLILTIIAILRLVWDIRLYSKNKT
ncbi:hypothetical protein [Pontibacillus yanchengensis]|uniref:Uncharacterized protein n=1 Tax=Pontibacillus yanchengensis Y32 TaxID=1385514 RepID=A0A0A2TDG7_9BACI|nr:hypothetical protein [Pontibacillus yanchengensis]KGP73609.1 hypothetical protein N782_03975 [Pontibacillus yanchengensis Y32]